MFLDRPRLLPIIKAKKSALFNQLTRGMRWNHPNRLQKITLSGTLDYVLSNGTTGQTITYAIDLGTIDFTRVFPDKMPFHKDYTPVEQIDDPKKFILAHSVANIWLVQMTSGAGHTGTVGTRTDDFPPAMPVVTDIGISDLAPLLTGGGLPADTSYAGGAGRGPGDPEEDVTITFPNLGWTGTGSGSLPTLDVEFTRSPYEADWSSELGAFSDWFDAWLAANTPSSPWSHSGSCDFTASFTFPA